MSTTCTLKLCSSSPEISQASMILTLIAEVITSSFPGYRYYPRFPGFLGCLHYPCCRHDPVPASSLVFFARHSAACGSRDRAGRARAAPPPRRRWWATSRRRRRHRRRWIRSREPLVQRCWAQCYWPRWLLQQKLKQISSHELKKIALNSANLLVKKCIVA